ncbi:MAG: PaaI family thioesterase [Burkholderiaceae bacterium]
MAMLGDAVLAMWWHLPAGCREEFEHWHVHEHFPERLGIPGFLRGSRWHGTDDGDSVFVIYELAGHDVLSSPAYLARLNAPTPWSTKMMPNHLGMVRTQCRVLASQGGLVGGHALTIRLSAQPSAEAALQAHLSALIDALPARPGLTGACLARHERPDIAATVEQRIRGADAEADWVLVVSGYQPETLRALAAGELGPPALAAVGAAADVVTGLYELRFSATPADVAPTESSKATRFESVPRRLPDGFQRHDRPSPLTAPWEPIYARHDEAAVVLAVDVRHAHCNSRGMVHGGLVAALADNAMGLSALRVVTRAGMPDARGVTVSLTIDFVEGVRIGDWLEFVPTVVRAGGTLAFVEFHARVGERIVARGSATFRIVQAVAAQAQGSSKR